MYALIQKSDNSILKIGTEWFDLSPEKPFYWVECPVDCTTQWTYDGSNFVPPIIPVIDPQIAINEEARAYLNSTDWYVVRFIETGVPIPQDILDARQAARDSIVDVLTNR